MEDIKKLSVLDFKKEQLVNLNNEEMMSVKGGASSTPCFLAALYGHGKQKSWWICPDNPAEDFYVTQHNLAPDITCASIDPDSIVIYG